MNQIPDKNKDGDCFQIAYKTFMEAPSERILVHGIVTGQGVIKGIKYLHAWVIEGDWVIDKTLADEHQRMPVALYNYIGKIEITRKYNFEQVIKESNLHGTYGEWDSELQKYID